MAVIIMECYWHLPPQYYHGPLESVHKGEQLKVCLTPDPMALWSPPDAGPHLQDPGKEAGCLTMASSLATL